MFNTGFLRPQKNWAWGSATLKIPRIQGGIFFDSFCFVLFSKNYAKTKQWWFGKGNSLALSIMIFFGVMSIRFLKIIGPQCNGQMVPLQCVNSPSLRV